MSAHSKHTTEERWESSAPAARNEARSWAGVWLRMMALILGALNSAGPDDSEWLRCILRTHIGCDVRMWPALAGCTSLL